MVSKNSSISTKDCVKKMNFPKMKSNLNLYCMCVFLSPYINRALVKSFGLFFLGMYYGKLS